MYLGAKEIKECPHKTVSRFYNSLPVNPAPEWRCDWCGQEFAVAYAASKTVEISEVGTATTTFQTSVPNECAPDVPKVVNGNVYGRAPNPSLAKKFRTERREAANYPRSADTVKEKSQ